MLGLLQGCLSIVLAKRRDAETGVRLGVRLSPSRPLPQHL